MRRHRRSQGCARATGACSPAGAWATVLGGSGIGGYSGRSGVRLHPAAALPQLECGGGRGALRLASDRAVGAAVVAAAAGGGGVLGPQR
jgi:hypothetical protein